MSIEENFTVVSTVVVIIEIIFMLICSVLVWRRRAIYPISYKNIYTMTVHNVSAALITFYFFFLLNYDLPPMTVVWPQFFLFPLYVGSHIVDTVRLYCMFYISKYRYLEVDVSYDGQVAAPTRLNAIHRRIIQHQQRLFQRSAYVKVLVIFVVLTTSYGLIVEIIYLRDSSWDKLWRLPVIVLIVLLFVSSFVMNVVLRHSNDSSGLKTEYRFVSLLWLLIIVICLTYYISVWVGDVNPFFFAFRKILLVLIFLPTFFFSALLLLIKADRNRENVVLFTVASKAPTLQELLQDEKLSHCLSQYLLGLFQPTDFQFVKAVHRLKTVPLVSVANALLISKKFLDAERETYISIGDLPPCKEGDNPHREHDRRLVR